MQFLCGLLFTGPRKLLWLRFYVGVVTPVVRFFSSNESAGRVLLHVFARAALNHAVNAHATERRPDPRRARVTKMLAMEELARAAHASGGRAQGGAAGH